jgi:hypothetical protein
LHFAYSVKLILNTRISAVTLFSFLYLLKKNLQLFEFWS